MASNLLIIHGIGNRDREGFEQSALTLGHKLGREAMAVQPIFWGDLAPSEQGAFEAIPTDVHSSPSATIPDLAGKEAAGEGAIESQIASFVRVARNDGAGIEAANSLAAATISELEGRGGAVSAETQRVIREAIQEAEREGAELPPLMDLSQPLAEVVEMAPPTGFAEIEGVSLSGVKDRIKKILHGVHRAAAGLAGDVLQRGLRGLEGALTGAVARTAGDILAYEKNGALIRGRLDQGYATLSEKGQPIDIVAHSLGALVAVEWLLGASTEREDGSSPTSVDDRVVRLFVSFGTQVSVFAESHGLATESGSTGVPSDGQRLDLPIKVGKWINVWHQLDPLGFVMGEVLNAPATNQVQDFRLTMARIPLSASEWWFHSSYAADARFLAWCKQQLDAAI